MTSCSILNDLCTTVTILLLWLVLLFFSASLPSFWHFSMSCAYSPFPVDLNISLVIMSIGEAPKFTAKKAPDLPTCRGLRTIFTWLFHQQLKLCSKQAHLLSSKTGPSMSTCYDSRIHPVDLICPNHFTISHLPWHSRLPLLFPPIHSESLSTFNCFKSLLHFFSLADYFQSHWCQSNVLKNIFEYNMLNGSKIKSKLWSLLYLTLTYLSISFAALPLCWNPKVHSQFSMEYLLSKSLLELLLSKSTSTFCQQPITYL